MVRLTRRVFTDLAIWMIGFGILMGVVFPFFVEAMGVPASLVMTPWFFGACILAGVVVGAVNIALARRVVGRTLRILADRMHHVQSGLADASSLGVPRNHDVPWCRINVDSADEIGESAEAFNRLVEALRQALLSNKLILEAAGEGICGLDAEGRLSFINRAATAMFGRDAGELIGVSCHQAVHHKRSDGSPYPVDECKIAATIKDGNTRRVTDEVFWRKDGSSFPVEYVCTQIIAEDRPSGAVMVFRDVTEQRKVAETLREREEFLTAVVDNLPLMLFIKDAEGLRFVRLNLAGEELLGYTGAELIGRGDSDFFPPEIANSFIEKDREVLRGGRLLDIPEEAIDTRHQGRRYLHTRKIPILDDQGRPRYLLGISEDITERRRLAEDLRQAMESADQANRAKSSFLATMSHEIRTPMNAIIGMTHLLEHTDLSLTQAEYVSKVRAASRRLLALINDILDFSKIEAGKLQLEKVPFDLDDVMGEVAALLGLQAEEKGIELVLARERPIPVPLIGDPLRVGQVLVNLASNAVKFTDRGEVVVSTILVDEQPDRVTLRFEVRDTGIGMTQEESVRVFQAFSQADDSTSRRHGGTGLGLAISRRLVELMGGEIGLLTEPGKGSTFHFTVTLGRRPEERRQRPGAPADVHDKKILVVDDNEAVRAALTAILASGSFRTVGAGSVDEAIHVARESGPGKAQGIDVILLDWRLPGFSGPEAVARLQGEPSMVGVPIVIMAPANSTSAARATETSRGLAGVIVRPPTPSSLFEAVLVALSRDRRRAVHRAPSEDLSAEMECLKGAMVLLVEDIEINQQIAVEILRLVGVDVQVASSGPEGVSAVLASYDTRRFDAVLMDLQMPGMDGFEATRAIRADRRFENLPIIAMTADALSGVRDQCLAAGMNDFATKPFEPADLFRMLAKWIGRRSGAEKRKTPSREPAAADGAAWAGATPGLDIEAGVIRVAGNRTLYLSLLHDFARDFADVPERVSMAIGRGERHEAAILLHTLKGVAGNLGVTEVEQAAIGLESAVQDESDSKIPSLEDGLDRAMAMVLRSIGTLPGGGGREPDPGGQGTTPAPGDLAPIVRELDRLLRSNDRNAKRAAGQLQAAVSGTVVERAFSPVFTCARRYDFKGALASLRSAAAGQGITLDEGQD